jgi:hypothetical protein
MSNLVTLRNNFHNTSAKILFNGSAYRPSTSTVKRVFNKLCGQKQCTCSDNDLGTRGAQQVNIDTTITGKVLITKKQQY